ncbi:hypothetical protein BCD67_13510 [Oscillatoriales cyanobacterium USR001]|nr:hypothetical protein BCD67_13510 [Oscillatoriales cyanobacterium USR001]
MQKHSAILIRQSEEVFPKLISLRRFGRLLDIQLFMSSEQEAKAWEGKNPPIVVIEGFEFGTPKALQTAMGLLFKHLFFIMESKNLMD